MEETQNLRGLDIRSQKIGIRLVSKSVNVLLFLGKIDTIYTGIYVSAQALMKGI